MFRLPLVVVSQSRQNISCPAKAFRLLHDSPKSPPLDCRGPFAMSHFAFDEAPIYLLSFVPAESVPLRSFQCPCVQTICTFCTLKVYILVTAPSNLLVCAIALQARPHGLANCSLNSFSRIA